MVREVAVDRHLLERGEVEVVLVEPGEEGCDLAEFGAVDVGHSDADWPVEWPPAQFPQRLPVEEPGDDDGLFGGQGVDECPAPELEVVESDIDSGQGAGSDQHSPEVPDARRLRELVDCVVADGLLTVSHGSEGAVDGFAAEPPDSRARVPGAEQVLAERGKRRVHTAIRICQDVTETILKTAASAVRAGQVFLTPAPGTSEP